MERKRAIIQMLTKTAITDKAEEFLSSASSSRFQDQPEVQAFIDNVLTQFKLEFKQDFDDVDLLALEVTVVERQKLGRNVWDADRYALQELCDKEERRRMKDVELLYDGVVRDFIPRPRLRKTIPQFSIGRWLEGYRQRPWVALEGTDLDDEKNFLTINLPKEVSSNALMT